MKVLFVSDSLGCPIEQRGIHNFSMSLIENLNELGAEVTLVLERPPARWMASRMKSSVVDLKATRQSVALAEVMRFFGERRYNSAWIHRWAERKFTPGLFKKLGAWAYIAFVRVWAGRTVTVDNDLNSVDFIPTNAYHLSLPAKFVVTPAVYSEMVLRAACGLAPDAIDAKGFDLVIVDTPCYFRVENIELRKIVAVVHDLIPLRDPMMAPHWRNLFLKKVEAMLAMQPNFAFVSEYSREIFRQSFPNYALRRSTIYYPTLRRSTVRRALQAKSKRAGRRFAPTELANLEASVTLQNQLEGDSDFNTPVEKEIALGAQYRRSAAVHDAYVRLGWNSRLPYFVTVVSDEPRKNIGIFLKAFATLKGRANMVILGNVEGSRYVGDDPNTMGHIRFTGYIPEAEKLRVIAMSDGLIFPSFTEGFGIPLIEGALYDKPVLCSDIEVFREVAGDAAFFFNPYHEDSLVAAVEDVLSAPLESHERALRLKARVLERFTLEAAGIRLRAFLIEAGLMDADHGLAPAVAKPREMDEIALSSAAQRPA